MLPRIAAIIRREYLERVRTKAFWISTLLVPIFMAAATILPALLAARGGGDYTIAVQDMTGRYFEPIADEVEDILTGSTDGPNVSPNARFAGSAGNLTMRFLAQDPEASREEIKQRIQNKEFDGLLVLPPGLPDDGQPEYVASNVTAMRMLATLERAINNVIIADRLTAAGIDPQRIADLTRRADMKMLKLSAKGEETRDRGQAFLMSFMLVMIIYMSVLMYGMYVMRGVLEEKASHIVEVIISTVKPFELMLGKILGIGAVGLTQMLLWSLMGFALTAPGVLVAIGIGGLEMPKIPAVVLVFFVIYFVLGFLLYGTLYAGVGAAFDTEQDAQNFQGVITFFLIIPMLLLMQILNQPDGTLAVVLSLFPFFTPILMFLRLTLTQVPAIQLIASVVLMVVTILAMAWLSGKIYRVGILMHGSKPKLKEMMRWIKEA
jgi:ABC-2 type transport system permease protein